MDVSSDESVAAAFRRVEAALAGTTLDVVINCAAMCPMGALEVAPADLLLKTLNTNAVGSARVLKAALPLLRGHNGRIALLTSLWGRVSGPMLSAYCSSKWAIEAIADSARREIHGQDVSIIVIEPGVVRTRLVDNQVAEAADAASRLPANLGRIYGDLYRNYHAMIAKNANGGVSADQCAAAIEKAVFARRPRTRYRVGYDSKFLAGLAAVLPDRALDGLFRRLIG
jgi:NAD(P)-dependent dehydrogenase (short-subunit alcohol dehydrogenase family)